MSNVQPTEGLQETSTVTPQVPDASPSPDVAPVAPPAETQSSGPTYVQDNANAPVNKTKYSEPELQDCPSCNIGKLYVIAYDAKALNEVGQPIYSPAKLSGGSVTVTCFNCGYGETAPLNPREAPVNPNPGA